jgi:hypothetical protein
VTAFIIAAGVFICVVLGALGGMWMSRYVHPRCHETATHDAIKLASGMLTLLAALVLGLLTTSIRSNFDTINAEVSSFAAQLGLLDQTLRDMGPETQAARGLLHQSTVLTLRDNWPEEAGVIGDSGG